MGNHMNAIRERRLRGAILTQREVAQAMGVKAAAVSKWETGRGRPRASLLPKIAKLYGCTVDDLLADLNDTEEKKE